MTDPVSPELKEELKPDACPFCATAVVDEAFWYACATDHTDHHVFCLGCAAEGPRCETLDLAITAWNRRADTASGGRGEDSSSVSLPAHASPLRSAAATPAPHSAGKES